MKTKLFIIAFITATFLTASPSAFSESEMFEMVSIYIEQNITDKDAEVVFFVKSTDEGLKALEVFDPKGKKVFQLNAEKHFLGTREFTAESPEPSLHEVLKIYPQGEYTFS